MTYPKNRAVPDFVEARSWSSDDDADLAVHVASGLSARAIGDLMGRSRHSVIGRTHRIGIRLLQGRDANKGISRQKTRGRKPPRGGHVSWSRVRALKSRAEDIAAVEEDRSQAKPFAEAMGRHVCKWFLSGEQGLHGMVCGHTTHPGLSYCPTHALRAYTRSAA